LDLAGHYDQQSVKTIQSQTTVSMAGFEVIMYAAFEVTTEGGRQLSTAR